MCDLKISFLRNNIFFTSGNGDSYSKLMPNFFGAFRHFEYVKFNLIMEFKVNFQNFKYLPHSVLY